MKATNQEEDSEAERRSTWNQDRSRRLKEEAQEGEREMTPRWEGDQHEPRISNTVYK